MAKGSEESFGRLSDERARILIEVPEVATPNEIRRLAQEAVDERTRAGFDAHTIKQLERDNAELIAKLERRTHRDHFHAEVAR